MPFGLTNAGNAPAVFQRLMQRILMGTSGLGFVVVYIDDVLVFSPILEEHLDNLKAVIQ